MDFRLCVTGKGERTFRADEQLDAPSVQHRAQGRGSGGEAQVPGAQVLHCRLPTTHRVQAEELDGQVRQ